MHYFLAIFLCLLTLNTPFAASQLQFEVSGRGMVNVDIDLDLATSASPVRPVVLPFDVDPRHKITKPDDIEAALVVSQEKYTLLLVIVPASTSRAKISIANAFSLVDDRAKDRVKFQFDMSYKNFKKHAALLRDSITISAFDISIRVPREYADDELSFEPSKDKWTKGPPDMYKISGNDAVGKKVFLAFPSPFKDAASIAQILIGALAGIITILLGSGYVIRRKIGKEILASILVLSLIGLFLIYHFYTSLADPLGFLAWVIGFAIPWMIAPFLCAWYLIRLRFDAEIGGDIYAGEQPAQYVDAEIYLVDGKRENFLKRKTVDEDGRYKAFIWCFVKDKSIRVIVKGEGFQSVQSNVYSVKSRSKTQIGRLTLTRVPLDDRPRSLGT